MAIPDAESTPAHIWLCLPSGPKTQKIVFYPIPTEYESALRETAGT